MPQETDIFDNILPLPYRVISLIVLGSWLWLLTLKISNNVGINITSLLKIDESPTSTNLTIAQIMHNHEKSSINISLLFVTSYIIFTLFHDQNIESLTIFDFLPLLTIMAIFYTLLKPNNLGSKRLLSSFKRILKGNIDQSIRTNDILLSDTLTSYSKILIDFAIYMCHIINFETCLPKSKGSTINRSCGDSILLESLVGVIPTLIRLRQCFIEYKISNQRNKTHLLNFIKYSTNIPILIISLIIKIKKTDKLTKIWVLASLINSTYSFIWDVNNDWDLKFFQKFIYGKNDHGVLRLKLHYNFKLFYYIAILLDFQFRYIWVLKFSPKYENANLFWNFLSCLYTTEFGLYCLQTIEIFRRWIWVFIKVEVDFINMNPLEYRKDHDSIELDSLKD